MDENGKKWFMRVNRKISNKSIETLKIWRVSHHCVSSKLEEFLTNTNPDYYCNVLDPDNSMSKFTMVLQFIFMKGISYQCN